MTIDNNASSKQYLGIDFGTSNSYFCLTNEGFLGTTPVMFDGQTSISTSILWEIRSDGTRHMLAFGDRAVEEWGFRSEAQRRNCRISTMFKPDIGFSESARDDATAFLKAATAYMDEQGMLPGDAWDKTEVILGVPAVQGQGFKRELTGIGQKLRFNKMRTIPEPVGALINHVASRNDISPAAARRGILVIDFGGGTCDIAYMLRLEVKAAWGDSMLGGRLFDDLFYQWYLEQNPGMEAKIKTSGDEYYVHWILCREMKERFSATMERDRSRQFSHHLHVADVYYGGLNQVTWEQFMDRAQSYRPGSYMLEVIQNSPDGGRFEPDGTINLIKWFSSILIEGVSNSGINLENIRYTILTGGSSAWVFVKDIVRSSLQLEPERLFFSANPLTAVGEGIALLPVIQELHRDARAKIRKGHVQQINAIISRVEQLAEDFVVEISDEIVSLVVDEEMRLVLSDFSRNGGKIQDLQQRIAETVGSRSRDCDALIRSREADILAAVNMEIVTILGHWFKENGMRNWSSDRCYLNDLGVSRPDTSRLTLEDPLLELVKTISHLVMMYGVGGILGGSGLALLIPGLPGLVLGAVIGVLFSMVGFEMFKKPLQKSFGKLRVPSWVASSLYSDRKLDKMVNKLRQQLKHDILENARQVFREKITDLRPAIADLVDAVVEDLTALDHL